MRTDVLGVGFDSLTMEQAVTQALEEIAARSGRYIVTPNPEIVWLCRKDKALGQIIGQAALVLPDGVGITLGAKILGRPLAARLPGIDFVANLLAEMARRGQSVFLYGAKPGVAEQAGESLLIRYPGLKLVGTADGYSDDQPTIAAIRAAEPDMLLVCLGAPRQEQWMARHGASLDVGLMAGLGGVLDVFSGSVKRAPKIFQKLGLEWFYRLCKEPRRIGRMMRLPLFLFAVIGQRIRRK
ncbi:MAG: WecB/TagA/CpsF family glycosyltransferase [Oscillospiraceae bacterium]|nr:WecB/TagA/CpsF family glycosyltransferase [Oscillospiraceae bacterium]